MENRLGRGCLRVCVLPPNVVADSSACWKEESRAAVAAPPVVGEGLLGKLHLSEDL